MFVNKNIILEYSEELLPSDYYSFKMIKNSNISDFFYFVGRIYHLFMLYKNSRKQ